MLANTAAAGCDWLEISVLTELQGGVDVPEARLDASDRRQMTMGFFFGYLIIALVLIPLYYRMNLTSIYGYLKERFGNSSYKTGASFFLLSRVIGASLRLYIVANVYKVPIFAQ